MGRPWALLSTQKQNKPIQKTADYAVAGDEKNLMYSAYLLVVFVTGVCMWSQGLCAVIISMAIHINVYMYTVYAYDMV